MRFHLMMIPPALVAASVVQAASFLTVEEAQRAIFLKASFTPADLILTVSQADELIRSSHTTLFRSRVRAWKVSGGGWFVLDQVLGRDDVITYAVGINKDGSIAGVEILVCEPGYDGIRDPQWIGHFLGTNYANWAKTVGKVPNISGATLSVEHVTEGVKRTLATYALFVAPKAP